MQRLKNNALKMLLACVLCLLLGFLLGKFKQQLLSEQIEVLTSEVQDLQGQHLALESKLTGVQLNNAADKQTIESLLANNKALQDDLVVANNKLFFYERVVAPELETKGVQVYSFEVTKNELTEMWNYQLVLMQSQKQRRLLKGQFDITLAVFENEQLRQIALSELSQDKSNSFKFKYFQTIQGDFSLPEGVSVDEVIINLSVPGNRWYKAQKLEARYDWRVLTATDSSQLSEFDSGESSAISQ